MEKAVAIQSIRQQCSGESGTEVAPGIRCPRPLARQEKARRDSLVDKDQVREPFLVDFALRK